MAVQDLYVLSGYWAPDYAIGDEGVYPISELQGVAPSAIIELFELDLNQLQHGITETYRFHAGSSLNANGELVWAGNSYMRFPVEADGFEYSGNGQLPRPKIRCSNILGTITALLLSLPSGLEGAKFTRIRTLARYLDEANFPPRRNLYNDTNLFAWSESATSSGPQFRWRQPNAALAPDDTLTATKLSVSDDNDAQRILGVSTGIAANTVVTFSVYAKAAEYSRIGIRATDDAVAGAIFNLQTGEWLVNSDATSQFAVYAGAGWWRIGITYTTTTGNPTNWIRIVSNNNFFTFTGDGTSGIYIWGAQLEANPSATEYQYIGSTWTRSPYGVPDPSAEFPREIFYVDRKVVETRDVVEFELAAAFDLAGVRAPKRQCISNVCQWVYRSAECGYTGPPIADNGDEALPTLTTSAEAIAYSNAEVAYQATVGPLASTRSTLNTATNALNTAQGNWYLAEVRYDASNKVEVRPSGTFAYWGGAIVSLGTVYRRGGLRQNLNTAYITAIYDIQRWDFDNSAVTTAQANYNAALAAYNSALSTHDAALATRDAALLAWQTSVPFASDIVASGDSCGKRLSSCRLRFGDTAELPFGSFPGIGAFFG
jgi:phage-related protein